MTRPDPVPVGRIGRCHQAGGPGRNGAELVDAGAELGLVLGACAAFLGPGVPSRWYVDSIGQVGPIFPA